jgi:hypothetical protein
MKKLIYILIICVIFVSVVILISYVFVPTAQPIQSSVGIDCISVLACLVPTSTPHPTVTNTPIVIIENPHKGVVFTGPTSIIFHNTFTPALVNADWWYDYGYDVGGNGFVPMLSFHPLYPYKPDGVLTTARQMPGSYWLIFNEPDRADQGNLRPTQAAMAYRQVRDLILPVDPTAKFIVGGVWTLTDSGSNWMIAFANEYKRLYGEALPMAGYHAHHYCDGSCTSWSFRKWIELFRAAVAPAGFTGEFWLTEYGILTDDTKAMERLTSDTAWLETTPMVTRFAWFATQNNYGSGSLLDGYGNLTPLGVQYKNR